MSIDVLALLLLGTTFTSSVLATFERIVTDPIQVNNGVAIDYRYNEKDYQGSNQIVSAPGCPKSIDGVPWVQIGATCYLAGTWNIHCDLGERVYFDGSPYGKCNCGCFAINGDVSFDFGKVQFCMDDAEEEYGYHPRLRKCFALYDQGPCATNQWLVKANLYTTEPLMCEPRSCPVGHILKVGFNGRIDCVLRKFQGASFSQAGGIIRRDCPYGAKFSQYSKMCVKTAQIRPGGGIGK